MKCPILLRFLIDRRGAVAIIFALALIPLCLAGGAAIDLGRAYLVKSRLGYALDAAGLAVGAASGQDEDVLEALMLDFFDANYPASELGVPAQPTLVMTDSEVELHAVADVSTTLMNVVGIHELTVSASTLVIRETKGLEVALVLDNTGSMGTTKMNSLKEASHIFLDILFGDDEKHDLLYVSVVPFAGTVNVGNGFGHLTAGFDQADFDPTVWGGCVMARTGGDDTTDEAPVDELTRWDAYLKPDYASNQWPPVSSWAGPNEDCPVEILPLTNTKSVVDGRIDDMFSDGITHINVGLAWGWRTISPGEPYDEAASYDDEEFNKAIVLMTDGENTFSSSSFGAYGFVSDGNLGTTSSWAAVNELNDRTTEICDAIKAQGVLIYTITFQVSSGTVQNLMADCASEPDNYFDSPDSATLEAAFRAIGKELSNLRLGG